jgi:hypothetical protein
VPLPACAPLVAFALAALALSVVVLVIVPDPGPLDAPDEGSQRSGLLTPAGQAERVASLELPGAPVGRRPVLLVFDRDVPSPGRFRRFLAELPDVAVVLSVPAGSSAGQLAGVPVVTEPRRLADAVGLATPRDGGAPVGYAVIDEQARIRYATLDPLYLEHADEAATMLAAVS